MTSKEQPKIKFIMETPVNAYGHPDGASLEMSVHHGIDKSSLYGYFLDFVKGCGYYIDNGVELMEENPDAPDTYNEYLENQVETLENKVMELEQKLETELKEQLEEQLEFEEAVEHYRKVQADDSNS